MTYVPPTNFWKLDEPGGSASFADSFGGVTLTDHAGSRTRQDSGLPAGIAHGTEFPTTDWAITGSALPQIVTDQFSTCYWVEYIGDGGIAHAMYCASFSGGHTDPYYTFATFSNGDLREALDTYGTFIPWDTSISLGDLAGSWHHFAQTYDGVHQTLYIDGVQVAQQAQTGNVGDMGSFAINNIPALGGSSFSTHQYAAMFGYWNDYCLTSGDIATLYAAGATDYFAAISGGSPTFPPTISGLTPPSGPIGQSVVIAGTNLDTVTAVDFNGTPAASFSDDSPIQITAVVDTGTTTGPVHVTNPDGTSTDDPTFTVTVPPAAPTITSLSPDHGPIGRSVAIFGTDFDTATVVDFDGISAAFSIDSSIEIHATVPVGAATGPVIVTNPGGTSTEDPIFTITIPPASLPYQSPAWRFVVLDLKTFEVLSFLDVLATARVVNYTLDAPAQAQMTVPSDNPEISIPWPDPDSDPFLTEGSRTLLGMRRDGPMGSPWTPRFHGIIMQLEDAAQQDVAYSHLTAWDPWQYILARPVCNADGSLPGPNGLSFTTTHVDVIIGTLLKNTIENNGITGIDLGAAYGGTSFYSGTIETCDPIDINFQQGTSVGEAWQQLTNQNDCDIVLRAIYDPVNRPGYMVEGSIYPQAGTERDDAIFAWDEPSRSLVQISRLLDGTLRANKVKFFAGQGGSASGGQSVPVQTDAASVTKFGEYWRQQFFPGQNVAGVVQLLAAAELALSKDGRETVTISPAPERSPIPFDDYFLGDRVPVYASSRFRAPLAGYQRIYGIPISIGDDQTESVQQLLTTEPTS